MAELFSLKGYRSAGRARRLIQRQIKLGRSPRGRIEQIKKMVTQLLFKKRLDPIADILRYYATFTSPFQRLISISRPGFARGGRKSM